MQSSLLVLCTVACSLLITDAAFLRTGEVKESEAAQQAQSADIHVPYYLDQYSPEVAQILTNPRLLQELHEAIQQLQQSEPEFKQSAPSKRAQTFVRFGKRAQTFVRFGRR